MSQRIKIGENGKASESEKKARCTRASVKGIDKESTRQKIGANGQVLRESTRQVRDKAMCKRASVKGIDKENQR